MLSCPSLIADLSLHCTRGRGSLSLANTLSDVTWRYVRVWWNVREAPLQAKNRHDLCVIHFHQRALSLSPFMWWSHKLGTELFLPQHTVELDCLDKSDATLSLSQHHCMCSAFKLPAEKKKNKNKKNKKKTLFWIKKDDPFCFYITAIGLYMILSSLDKKCMVDTQDKKTHPPPSVLVLVAVPVCLILHAV